MRGVILLETLCQIGLAFGTGKLVRRVVFCANGGLGFALQLVQQREAVAKLVAIIRHPPGRVTRGRVAGYQAKAPIRGRAKTAEPASINALQWAYPGVS